MTGKITIFIFSWKSRVIHYTLPCKIIQPTVIGVLDVV